MTDEMWCFNCAESVKPRTKWAVDAVIWLCPKCGKHLEMEIVDDEEVDDGEE